MSNHRSLTRPAMLLMAMAFVSPLTFSVWNALLNNFVVERAAFTGQEIGILQSLREVLGFLTFTVIFLLMFIREQRLAVLSLITMAGGVAVTGLYPSALGLYVTTILMSVGFHYFEAVNSSLTLQWLPKEETPHFMGQVLAIKAVASLLAYGAIWVLMGQLGVAFEHMYLLAGSTGLALIAGIWMYFPQFEQHTLQHPLLARRQIFMVFAAFMMVEKFGYSVSEISALYMLNYLFNLLFAPRIGAWIGHVGERFALTLEYVGLVVVFASYAVVSFTINHIAAVVVPVVLGAVWLYSPASVFLVGATFALMSLILARMIPINPQAGNETRWHNTHPAMN